MEKIIGYGTYIIERSWNVEPIPIIVPGYNRIMLPGLAFPIAVQNPSKSFRALLYEVDDIARTDMKEFALPHPTKSDAVHQLFYRKEVIVFQEVQRERHKMVKWTAWIYLPTLEAARIMSISFYSDKEDEWVKTIRDKGIGNIFPELLENPRNYLAKTPSHVRGLSATSVVIDEADALDKLLKRRGTGKDEIE